MSDKITDEKRASALGAGLAKQAALAKMLRTRRVDAAVDQATGLPQQEMAEQLRRQQARQSRD